MRRRIEPDAPAFFQIMTASSDPSPATLTRRLSWRISALLLCLVVAFAAALFWKRYQAPPPRTVAPTASPQVELEPKQILANLPPVAGDSTTAKAVTSAIAKVKEKPDLPTAWVNLGDALAQLLRETENAKFYDSAELAYQRALKLDPRSVDAMSGMAWVTGGQHLFDQSVAWAKRALVIDPRHAPSHGIVGDAALELGDYEQAFDEYQKMMDLRPDLSSWSRGSYLLWLTGDHRKGVWLMEKAIKSGAPFAENTAWCRAKLALMLFHEGAYLPAAQVLQPALEKGTRNAHVLLAAGRVAAAQGDVEGAMSYYERVLKGGPNHEALASLGDLHAARGEKEKAEEFYQKVEALHATHLATGLHDHMLMAKFYADHDRNLIEALRLAEQRKLTRNVLEADVLAWTYFKNDDLPRAREAMKRALRQQTPDAEMHYHAGMIAAAAGDRGAAQKELGRTLSLNPKFDPLQAPIAARKFDEVAGRAAASSPASPAHLATGP